MENLYQHFRKEEQPFIDQVMEWRQQVEAQYTYKKTDFLDPREQFILKTIIGQGDILYSCWGGYESAERKRAIIYPSYYSPEEDDYGLALFKLDYPSKFVSVEHPQVLGSLMSLGLKRSKFGDVLTNDDEIQIIVSEEIASYVESNLQSVGKAKIALQQLPFSKVLQVEDSWETRSGTVSSLRLDAVLSEAFRTSRQKMLPLLQSGRAKVNWRIIENPAYECKPGDTLSVRGFGRCKVMSIEGKTKKEKWRIVIGFQK
jgi:RNA-binding protein YlmH